LYGHAYLNVRSQRVFDEFEVRYELYWRDQSGRDNRFSTGKKKLYITDIVEAELPLRSVVVEDENVSIWMRIKIYAKDAAYLIPYEFTVDVNVTQNVSGSIFENGISDFEKRLRPTLLVSRIPYCVNTTNISMDVYVCTEYSTMAKLDIMLNDIRILEASNISSDFSITVELKGLPEGRHEIAFVFEYGGECWKTNYTFTVDLTPPILDVSVESPCKELRLAWTSTDLSGIKSIDIYVNDTHIMNTDNASGIAAYSLEEGLWIVSVYAVDYAGWVVRVDKSVVIDITPPRIVLVSPDDNDVVVQNGSLLLSFMPEDNVGVDYARVIVDMVAIYYLYGEWAFRLELDVGSHTIVIEVFDTAGNRARIYVFISVVENTGYQAASIANSSISVAPNTSTEDNRSHYDSSHRSMVQNPSVMLLLAATILMCGVMLTIRYVRFS